MKSIRNSSLRSLLILALVSFCAAATSAQAQSRDARFISAKAGGVNFVSGKVASKRSGEKEWFLLSTNDDLKSGDVLKTGADGRVELLLNPGSYLRLGENSEVKLVDASLDDLRLSLLSGSAVIEATGYSELDLSIMVETPQTQVRIARTGIYRLDVLPSNVTELTVQKGRAYIGQPELRVKGGKVVRVGAGTAPEVAKLDKDDRDALDLWSRERGRELAKINEKLSRRNTNALLASANFDNLFSMGSRFGPAGVWFRGSGNCYTFLPFYSYWRSPYGYGYGNQLYAPYGFPCSNCNGGRYNNPTVANGGGANSGGTNNGGYVQPPGGSTQPSSGGPSRVIPSQPREPRSFENSGGQRPMRERTIHPNTSVKSNPLD